jgi:hypothetical protein
VGCGVWGVSFFAHHKELKAVTVTAIDQNQSKGTVLVFEDDLCEQHIIVHT